MYAEVVPGTDPGGSAGVLVPGFGVFSCEGGNEGSAECPPLVVAEGTEGVGGWDVVFEVANSRLDDTDSLLRDARLCWSAELLYTDVEHADTVWPR